MALKGKGEGVMPEAKKRKRVGFAKIDTGIEVDKCMKICLVRNPEEVDRPDALCINPVDLGQFFGEDGKIYGYKDLKIVVWWSFVSFRAYADITFESTSDGGKGITDLKSALERIFGEVLVEKDVFLQSFTYEKLKIRSFISEGTVLRCDPSTEDNDGPWSLSDRETSKVEHQVIRMDLHSTPAGVLYSLLLPFVLLLVEGGSPIDVTDPRWEIYFIVKKLQHKSGDYFVEILGFAAAYRFYHYPESVRLRIGQILVLPPYQGVGHGRRLLESVNSVAEAENVYDVTIEDPSDQLQFVRAYLDSKRLLAFDPIKPAISSLVSYLKEADLSKRASKLLCRPPANMIETVRQALKIYKKQFLKCWEVLIFINLDAKDTRSVENFRACVSNRVRCDLLDNDSENSGKCLIEVPNNYDHDMTFVVFRSQAAGTESAGQDVKLAEGQATQEQQLNELIDKEMEEINMIAQKIIYSAKS